MKGIIHKEEYGWVVRYKKQPNDPWFEVPIEIGVSIKEEHENREVEFKIISGLNPYDGGNICDVARLSAYKRTWYDIENEFVEKHNVDLEESKLSFISFLNYLKQNYNVPTKINKQ